MSNEPIRVFAELDLHQGKEKQVFQLIDACKRYVSNTEPGTIQYDWFIDEDGGTVRVLETYSNQTALEVHIDRGPTEATELTKCADLFGSSIRHHSCASRRHSNSTIKRNQVI